MDGHEHERSSDLRLKLRRLDQLHQELAVRLRRRERSRGLRLDLDIRAILRSHRSTPLLLRAIARRRRHQPRTLAAKSVGLFPTTLLKSRARWAWSEYPSVAARAVNVAACPRSSREATSCRRFRRMTHFGEAPTNSRK